MKHLKFVECEVSLLRVLHYLHGEILKGYILERVVRTNEMTMKHLKFVKYEVL